MASRNNGQKAFHATQTSDIMKRVAERNKCPKCQRKAAIVSATNKNLSVSTCKWDDCDYTRVLDLATGKVQQNQ